MKREIGKRSILLAALVLFALAPARAQLPEGGGFFPQIVDGGGWQTTLVFANTSTSTEGADLGFFKETGGGATATWNLSLEGPAQNGIIIPPGGTVFLRTAGTARTMSVGWGQFFGNYLVAYAILTQSVNGGPQDGRRYLTSDIQSATETPFTLLAPHVVVPFDNTNGRVTSIAIASPLGSISVEVGIQIEGIVSQPTPLNLPANGHAVIALPSQFPATAGQQGLLELYDANGSFAAIALLSGTGGFGTAPVFPESGPPIIIMGGALPQAARP